MTNEEENVLNNTLNKMEYFTKLLGNRNTYENEEQCARIIKDLSEAYLNITKACGMRLEEDGSQVMGISYLHQDSITKSDTQI